MNSKLNKYWILVAVFTIANIAIFAFMSRQLGGYVEDSYSEVAFAEN